MTNLMLTTFVYNIDKTGFLNCFNTRSENVVVTESYKGNSIQIPVPREEKIATMLTGISTYGDDLKPLIILPRKTMEQEIYECGYKEDKVACVTKKMDL